MYHNVFRYEYLTFQTQIHLHKQYIFDTNITQSKYAFLFPFSIFLTQMSMSKSQGHILVLLKFGITSFVEYACQIQLFVHKILGSLCKI